MTLFHKLSYLLSKNQKRQLVVLAGLMVIGMLYEMAGLGILIPALSLMLNPDIAKEYPSVQPLLDALGNPTQTQLVIWGMSTLVMVYLTKAVFLIFLSWRQSRFSANLTADLSRDMFLGYLHQPYTFHLQRNSSELLRNIQIEIAQFSSVSQSAISLSIELSVVIGIAFMLILVEPLGALLVTSFFGLSALGFQQLTKNNLLIWGKQRQLHAGLLNKHLMQGLGGVKDVKLLGRENHFLKEFSEHNDARAKIQVKVTTLGLIPRVYLELLAVIGLAGLIVMMMVLKRPLDLLLPTLGVFIAAAFRLMPSVNRIMIAFQQIRYSKPVVEVLFSEFNLIRSAEKIKTTNSIYNFNHELKLETLSFLYTNSAQNALDKVSITIKKGESVGFVGPSGSGKSTLVDVIIGLLIPDKGEILVDGQAIQKNIRSWQDQIGYVPQTIYLTDDTLKRNVAFGLPNELIDDEAVARAIKASQLDEFVQSLPMKLETYVGERGIRLSGGQRQRIGIARALYHDPSVLVLDEATSALDSATEYDVMQSISALHGSKTLIIVAHRLSTVEHCDRIYRLKKGKVVDEGSPKEILIGKS